MNKRETYEIIIARKLEQLSVPAMEDAIWDRISNQLDIEMPENPQPEYPQPEPPQPKPPRPGDLFRLNNTILKIASLSISAIAVTAIIIYLSLKYNTSTPQPAVPSVKVPAPVIQPVQPPLPADSPLAPPGIIPEHREPVITKPDTISVQKPVLLPPVVPDSIVADSPFIIYTPPVRVLKPDTVPGRKKPAGVKGINDDDYRIAPRKH